MSPFSLVAAFASFTLTITVVNGFSPIKQHGRAFVTNAQFASGVLPTLSMSATVEKEASLSSYSSSEDCNIRNIAVIAHGTYLVFYSPR